VWAEARPALAGPARLGFVHLDYTTGNVVVERGSDGAFALSGVFDLHTAAFDDGEKDLSRQLAGWALAHPETAAVFVAAYSERRPLRPGWRERFRLYMLRDRMILWHYGRREGIWFPADATLRGFAAPFLEGVGLVERAATVHA